MPWVRSWLGHDLFLPCDIWWLSMGWQLGHRASKCACLIVPSRFGDESNYAGGKCQRTTMWLGWQSARLLIEGSWVRYFSQTLKQSPCPGWGLNQEHFDLKSSTLPRRYKSPACTARQYRYIMPNQCPATFSPSILNLSSEFSGVQESLEMRLRSSN